MWLECWSVHHLTPHWEQQLHTGCRRSCTGAHGGSGQPWTQFSCVYLYIHIVHLFWGDWRRRNDSKQPPIPAWSLQQRRHMDVCEECSVSEWEAALELDEALAGWLQQGPARGEWGWEWGWAAASHLLEEPEEREPDEIPAVSPAVEERVERVGANGLHVCEVGQSCCLGWRWSTLPTPDSAQGRLFST